MESSLMLLLSLVLVQSSSAQLLRYVKSSDLSSQDCPGRPCLTLDQYIQDAEEYFTTGTTFIFLNGQHTLQRTVSLTNVSGITLTQEDYSQVNLICMSEGAFIFEDVSNMTIKGLVFMSQLNIKRQNLSLLFFVSSRQIRLLNVTFQGNQQFRAIYSNQSFLTIVTCHFEDYTGDNGGALYAEHSVIMLKGSNFTHNRATYGGAICALTSSINIYPEENSTSYNQSLHRRETMLTDNSLATIFLDNEVSHDGGAIYLGNSTLTMSGTIVIFANNSAKQGGAISCRQHSVIYSTTRNLHFLNNTARSLGGAIILVRSSLYFGSKVPNLASFLDINSDIDCDLLAEKVEVKVNITIFSCNQAESAGGAIFLDNATTYLSGASMIFDSNTAEDGGALKLQDSSSVISNTEHLSFSNNVASNIGGAISSLGSFLTLGSTNTKATICLNSEITTENLNSTAGYALSKSSLYFGKISDTNTNAYSDTLAKKGKINITTIFSHNQAEFGGGGIFLGITSAYLSGTNMIFDSNSAKQGGALMLHLSSVVSYTEHLSFNHNVASIVGGAIVSLNSCMILGDYTCSTNHYFINNSCGHQGGAIYHSIGLLAVLGNSLFTENQASADGGAIFVATSNNFRLSCTTIFTHNHAKLGGALVLLRTGVVFTGKLEFRNNSAKCKDGLCFDVDGRMRGAGGAIFSQGSQMKAQTQELKFIENSAAYAGGAISAQQDSQLTILSAHLIKNRAKLGGAIHLDNNSTTTISGTRFYQNSGESGGALHAIGTFVRLLDYTVFSSNKANDGGAIYGFDTSKFMFNGLTEFDNNTAEGNGGGIYSINVDITFNNTVQFTSNSALNGGAMYFESGTILTIEQGTNLTTSYNHAVKYGGVIYYVDSATANQCDYNWAKKDSYHQLFFRISYCFIYLNGVTVNGSKLSFPFFIKSYYDSAGKDGSYIYGGFMDKCQMSYSYKDNTGIGSILVIDLLKDFLRFTPINNTNKGISSKPYQLCFCQNHSYVDCFGNYTVQVYRGQKFNVSLVATAQDDVYITLSTQVTVKLNPTARLNLNQSSQVIKNCSAVTYNVYSTEEYEELVTYPADSPCIDRGLARAVIEVTLLPCPDGFTQSSEQCVCEERLLEYDADCTIDERIVITKRSINFWMSVLYINQSYEGLILYKICPIKYCKSGNVSMSLDDVNIQCDFNRTGILCGACAANYSLLLGSSTCQICSNMYLSLLVPFALAGLGLVIFLTFLRLTVATGLINSLILYANIVQANKNLFFPPNTRNFLTVFIAWMNLDLGFETCFYHGMDGYAQTWLQFAFPLYVWMLISLIIISSRYSIKVSRLIGSNPIAVLATLLLLSYTKILKIVIEVFSFVKLDYPGNKKVIVWLKDANVPYMGHEHLILTVATFCIILSFFLPYTLLLLLGYKLYSFQWCRKYFHCWLMRFRPLLDSYYAPYNICHRYWTGLMLLVRCVLYITFSYNSLGETNGSLLAIIVVFVSIGFYLLLMRIYKEMFNNLIEVVMYLNLIILSTVTLANSIFPAMAYTSVGIVFASFASVCVYHLYIFYLHKTWLNFKARFAKTDTATDRPLLAVTDTPPDERIFTTSVVEVREPLLES